MNVRIALLIFGAAAVVVGAVWAAGVDPIVAYNRLYHGSLGTGSAISGTLRETSPLLIAGIAVFIALRAGLFNIGVEGQLVVGAVAAAWVALSIPGPIGIVLAIAAGTAAGGIWALPAGLIRAYRGGHEVITTIMLNNVAAFLTTALVAGPLRDRTQESTTTAILPDASRIPNLVETPVNLGDVNSVLRVNAALLMGIILLVVLAFWLRRTVGGFELSLVGANPRAAELAGVRSARTIVGAMAVSGMVGGFAGALQVLAYEGRFFAGISSGYGFDALGVALLAGASPWGMIPSSLLFGILAKGSTSIQILGVPKGLTYVILGLLILVFAAVRYRRSRRTD